MQNQNQGIARYVTIYVVIFMTILLLAFAYVLHLVYNWGSDDTVHYFMAVQAEQVSQDIARGEQNWGREAPPKTVGEENASLVVYPRLADLPEPYLDYFPAQYHYHAELLVYELPGKFIYLLPYFRDDNGELFYLSHTYFVENDDDLMSLGMSVSELTIFLFVLSLLVAYGLALKLAWSFIKPVQILADWSQSLADGTHSKLNGGAQNNPAHQSIPKLSFTELDQVASQIHRSVEALKRQNQKEKQFLRCLSHELRTPLAITKASLELIAKTVKDIPDKLNAKLTKIKRANESMCSTSETLLWLWSENMQSFNQENIQINDLVIDIVESNRYLIPEKNISIANKVEKQIVYADRRLVQIILRNLIRNAFQYTQEGVIEISYHNNGIVVTNPTGADKIDNSANNHYQNEFGFGVGLHLVESICRQLKWTFTVEQSPQRFVATVGLNPRLSKP